MIYRAVGVAIDTWIINVKGILNRERADELEDLKRASQETDDDLLTPWTFAGEPLHIKAHGSGRQWRWILHCPSLHLDIGAGKLNHIIGKARLSSAYLWEVGPEDALSVLYGFLVDFYGLGFELQVSEVHLCADIAGWEPSLEDAPAFITRGHRRKTHTERIACEDADHADETDETADESTLEVNFDGRRCTGYEFSKGAIHSCCIYDKTKEITVSRKAWMQEVWRRNGWDGVSRVTRVEFRYKRECLKELGVEEPYAMLDQFAGMWAYSTMQWLRHPVPTHDTNRGRWQLSPFWQLIQAIDFSGEPVPLVREKKRQGNLKLICQMLSGCSTTAAAYLAGLLPEHDDGTHFLIWFMQWQEQYLKQRGNSFEELYTHKRLRLGIQPPDTSAA
jgi:hypothetical protein